MSCSGCRVLRKGCTEFCILRPCLKWIESPEAQGHATFFVAKFFGRAGLMAFISAVPEFQRPAIFQSLLFEACGRTINPVSGAVGLLCTRNWHLCQAAVKTVLGGGMISPIKNIAGVDGDGGICDDLWDAALTEGRQPPAKCDLELYLRLPAMEEKRRPGTPSLNSVESVATSDNEFRLYPEPRLLNLFV